MCSVLNSLGTVKVHFTESDATDKTETTSDRIMPIYVGLSPCPDTTNLRADVARLVARVLVDHLERRERLWEEPTGIIILVDETQLELRDKAADELCLLWMEFASHWDEFGEEFLRLVLRRIGEAEVALGNYKLRLGVLQCEGRRATESLPIVCDSLPFSVGPRMSVSCAASNDFRISKQSNERPICSSTGSKREEVVRQMSSNCETFATATNFRSTLSLEL